MIRETLTYSSLLTLIFLVIATSLQSQNVGVGTSNPVEKLDVDGTVKADAIRFLNSTSKLEQLSNGLMSLESTQSVRINSGVGGSVNNSFSIHSNNTLWAYFDGEDKRLGIGTNVPTEKLHLTGGLRLGNASNNNSGTIRWNGTDFSGYNGTSWESFTKNNMLIDDDSDTKITLEEAVFDKINYTANDLNYKEEKADDSGTTVTLMSDPQLGINESVSQNFLQGGVITGSIYTSEVSPGRFSILGEDRVFLRGAYTDATANHINVSIGDHFSSYGVIINRGSNPVGQVRALLDVKGEAHIDTITVEDIINLTPRAKPNNPTAGMIYMDDGNCNACGGIKTLRYHNGNNWVNL